jgi:tRNA/tmRNA/rRNA uracil-C5-methylase (TrmA/RlmC/RlmD family)
VVGIEIVNDAIIDAQYNAQINKMSDRTYYVAGKTEHLIYNDPIIEQKKENLGLIILDPPRE